jgi:hypothetical protein
LFKFTFVSCMVVFATTVLSTMHNALGAGVASAAHSAGASAGSALGWSLVQRSLPLLWQATSLDCSWVSTFAGFMSSVSQAPVLREAKQHWIAGALQDAVTFNLW